MIVTVNTISLDGHRFMNWQENGKNVYNAPEYTFEVTGDRNLTAILENVSGRLPLGYREVEYIQSDNYCGIDTGYSPSLYDDKIIVDIMAENYTSGDEYIFGNLLVSNRNIRLYRTSSDTIGVQTSSLTKSISADISNVRALINWDSLARDLRINGEFVTSVSRVGYSGGRLYLFSHEASNKSIKAKLYSAKVYNQDSLIRDFIPCIDPANTIGLYDLVEGQFHQNAWSGMLTAGPAV